MRKLTFEEEIDFLNENKCYFCEKDLGLDRVRDHNHLNGEYRGASHKICNLKYSKKIKFVPIYFHNLGGKIYYFNIKGYDLHFIIESLGKYCTNINIIPKSKEKYLSLTVNFKNISLKLRFLDSMNFINGSLASWAKKLDINNLKYIIGDDKILRYKQILPYQYFKNTNEKSIIEILNEKELPKENNCW
jgi:hypothetical protein